MYIVTQYYKKISNKVSFIDKNFFDLLNFGIN
jgi:hypothetical protein